MANPAFEIREPGSFLTRKDTFIFDGNSRTAHIIARTILVNDPSQKFHLLPRQNADFFGIELPGNHEQEKFILLMQTGEILFGNHALEFISERLKLTTQIH